MKVIGLTGGIGSGKSCVARFMEELGAGFVDADKVTHEIYNPGTPGWQEVVETFGRDILDAQGFIDRKKLAQKAFSSSENHQKLNGILHPLIRQEVENQLNKYRQQGKKVAILEAILLVEAGWMNMVDELWLVEAPKNITLERLGGRGLKEPEALARMAAQTPFEKLKPYATVIIHNEGNLEALKAKVGQLWNELHSEGRKQSKEV